MTSDEYTATAGLSGVHSASDAAEAGRINRSGRPPGPSKLLLTKAVKTEIARRVRLRIQISTEHSMKAIARDLGVTETIIGGAIARMRKSGNL